jgi:MAternally affected uncoordination
MQPCANLIENMKAENQYQMDSLKIFFLILQVTYFLQCGQSKSALVTLRSLQNLVQLVLNRRDESILF